jgi:hypothetical protein
MVQIFQQLPDPGVQSAQAIAQLFGGGLSQGIGAGLSAMLEEKKQQQKTKALFDALGLGQPQKMNQSAEITNQGKQIQGGKLPQLTQEQILAASIQNPGLAPTLSAIYKNQQKESAESQQKEIGQYSLDRMAKIVDEGKIGLGSKIKAKAFGGKTAEDVGEFESLSGALEAMLVDKVSRGTLSNARFKYITETLLPKPNDRDATIRGKLKALAKELDLKTPELKPSTSAKKESSLSKKDFVLMQDPNGIIRKIPKNQAIQAQQAGGKLVQ